MLNFRSISIFRQAAYHSSFTEAAAYLGCSTAAVSRAIARLEDALGVRLFHRTTRNLQLTAEGQTYLAEVECGLERIEAAGLLLQQSRTEAIGKVRVLLPDTFCKNFVLPSLAEILDLHPRLEVDMHVQEFGKDPITGGFDVAVQFEAPRDNMYIAKCLGTIQIILAASPKYLNRRGTPKTIAELKNHECINLGITSEHPMDWHLLSTSPEESVRFKPQGRSFFSGQFDAGIVAATQHLGICQMDVAAALPHLTNKTLRVVLPAHEILGPELFLIYPHREHMPMKTRVVIDFLTKVARGRLRPPNFDPHAYTE